MDKIKVARVDQVILERFIPPTSSSGSPTRQRSTGTLHLTPHHLIFSPDQSPAAAAADSAESSKEDAKEIWIPYPMITQLNRLPQSIQGLYPLHVSTRHFESYTLLFQRPMEGGAEDVWQSVKNCAVTTSIEQLYAFFYQPPSPVASTSKTPLPSTATSATAPLSTASPLSASPERPITISASISPPPSANTGWNTFNPRAEFARQGLGSRTKAWRFTDINKDYAFCSTYPSKLVVPSRISDSTLAYAGKYRSKARIPALSYLHWANHASITRSSQPMVGLKNSRSAQDERLVECIFSSHHAPDSAYAPPANPLQPTPIPASPVYGATATNLIIDARPTTNAMANVAMGAGTENMENYKTGKKAYLGIDNIHVMRNSLKTVVEAIREAEADPGEIIDRTTLRKSNWLRHISTLLDGALVIVRNIHLNASHVLVHCSDGWDRTSQLSALAQVCLDPYYRTFEGFKVLIEKDWLAFGHKFLDRSGHFSSERYFTFAETPEEDSEDEGPGAGAQKAAQAFFASVQKQFSGSSSHLKEISPVFHQFLDCVRQIQRQYPERFQFNEEYLIELHYQLYACQFGTFLFNCEKQRRVPPGTGQAYVDRTTSLWESSLLDEQAKYRNEQYEPKLDDKDSREADADQGVLLPDPKDVKFWFRLFRRSDEEMNGSKIALSQATGADIFTVIAGQVDPVSAEGIVEGANVLGGSGETLQVPYAPRSRPSSAANPSLHLPATEFDANDAYRPHTHLATPLRSASPAQAPGSKTRSARPNSVAGGGWGWSQISTGALSALSGAAKEIRTMGQEAYNQMRAEVGEVNGSGSGSGSAGAGGMASYGENTGIGEGRPSGSNIGTAIPRIPSEANPWGDPTPTVGPPPVSVAKSSVRPGLGSRDEAEESFVAVEIPRPTPAGRGGKTGGGWTGNPWMDSGKKDDLPGSLDRLSLGKEAAPAESQQGAQRSQPVTSAEQEKSWDPLGAV